MNQANTTGRKSAEKLPGNMTVTAKNSQIMRSGFTEIPSFIFRDRSVAVLESLVEYLKDQKKLSYHEIAVLLNRNDRTIWTVYRRAKLKRKGLIRYMKRN